VEKAAQQEIDDSYGRTFPLSHGLLGLISTVNWYRVHSLSDFEEKEVEYMQLKETWGTHSTSRACKTGPYYHVPKQRGNTTRDPLRTPTPRILKAGGEDFQVKNLSVPSNKTTEVGNVNKQSVNHHAGSGATTKTEKMFVITGDCEKDPFYEPGDVPRLLPRGADPLYYLTTFGYPPPPIFMLDIPHQITSPSDFGTPLI